MPYKSADSLHTAARRYQPQHMAAHPARYPGSPQPTDIPFTQQDAGPAGSRIPPPSATPAPLSDQSEEAELNAALSFVRRNPIPPHVPIPRLSRPIAIPQLKPGPGAPFARAYAPTLSSHAIPAAAFLAFLDSFNNISSGTPPLRVLDMTSGALGLVPWHYAQLLSLGVKVAAQAGNRIVASVRGDRFVERVNAEFFAPRGLRMRLVAGEAMAQMLGVSVAAMVRGVDAAMTEGRVGPKVLMETLDGRVEALTFDVPPPEKADNVLDQLSARVQAGEAKKIEKKALKEAQKHADRSVSDSSSESSSGEEKARRKATKVSNERVELEAKRDRELEKVRAKETKDSKRAKEEAKIWEDFEEKVEKLDKKISKHGAKQGKDKHKHKKDSSKDRKKESKKVEKMGKLQWMVIDNLQ